MKQTVLFALLIILLFSCKQNTYVPFKLTWRAPNSIETINRPITPEEKAALIEKMKLLKEDFKDSAGILWIKIPAYYNDPPELYMWPYVDVIDSLQRKNDAIKK